MHSSRSVLPGLPGEAKERHRCSRKGIDMSLHVLPFAAQRSTGAQPAAVPAVPVAAEAAPAVTLRAVPSGAVTTRPRLRLTRRGRLVFVGAPLMLAMAALLAFIGFFTAPAMASGDAPEQTRAVQVGVSDGDSLWSLATEFAPDRDPRSVVADIVELNNLQDTTVPAGRQLYIPIAD